MIAKYVPFKPKRDEAAHKKLAQAESTVVDHDLHLSQSVNHFENHRSVEWALIYASLPRPLSLLNSSNSWEVWCSTLWQSWAERSKSESIVRLATSLLHKNNFIHFPSLTHYFENISFHVCGNLFRQCSFSAAMWERNSIKIMNESGQGSDA